MNLLKIYIGFLGGIFSLLLVLSSIYYPLLCLIGTGIFILLTFFLLTKGIDIVIPVFTLSGILLLVSFNFIDTTPGILILFCLVFFYIIFSKRTNIHSTHINNQKRRIPNYSIFIVWLIYAIIQLSYSAYYFRTFYHIRMLVVGLILIVILVKLVDSKAWFNRTYILWGITLLLTICIGWWEVFSGSHLPTSGAMSYSLNDVVTAGFYNPNDYSFFLGISLPVIFFWVKKKSIYKVIGYFMLLSSLYFFYLNGSRSIMLVSVLVIFFFFIEIGIKRKGLFMLMLTLLGITIFFKDMIIEGYNEVMTLFNSTNSLLGVRLQLYSSTFNVFKEYPFGVGPGNVELYMPIEGDNVHNFFLEVLANYGIIIFVALVTFFVISIYKICKASKTEDINEFTKPILWSTIIFIPASFVSSSIFQFGITWFLFGMIICTLNLIRTNPSNN